MACWEIQLKAAVFHILGVDEVKKGARSLEILVQTSGRKRSPSRRGGEQFSVNINNQEFTRLLAASTN